jgi:hypothetical protein
VSGTAALAGITACSSSAPATGAADGNSTPADGQLAWLVDRAQIGDVLHAFARALDTQGLGRVRRPWFTEDGELVSPGAGHKGSAGLANYVRNDLGVYAGTHHISGNHQITITR